MKKINSEVKVDSPFFKSKWGTIDKKNPSIIYLEIGTYISPKEEKESYSNSISEIDKNGKVMLRKTLIGSKSFNPSFIFVTDVADTRILFNKRSYLSFQIHLSRKKEDVMKNKPFKEVVNEADSIFHDICYEIKSLIEENGFECFKTKN